MLLYPIQETKTEYSSQAWASLTLVLLSLIGFATVYLPLQEKTRQASMNAFQNLQDIIGKEVSNGRLQQADLIRFQEKPAVIIDPQYTAIYSKDAQTAYRAWQKPLAPLEMMGPDPLKRLSLMITPHQPLLIIAALFALGLAGFVLEHCYDRQIVLAFFLITGVCLIVLEPHIPATFFPSPIFAWANTISVMLIIAWGCAPSAKVTLIFKAWLFKGIEQDFEIPLILAPLGFIAIYLSEAVFLGDYKSHFSALGFIAVLALAALFAILLTFLPTRPNAVQLTNEEEIDRRLSQAEQLYNEGKVTEMEHLIREITLRDPDANRLAQIGELSLNAGLTELADQCYRGALRRALSQRDHFLFLSTINHMLFRQLEVPGSVILKGWELAIQATKQEEMRKLLPQLLNHDEIQLAEKVEQIKKTASTLMAQKDPDRTLLLDIKLWLEKQNREPELLEHLNLYFQNASAQSQLTGMYEQAIIIHRAIPVTIIEVGTSNLILGLSTDRQQRVPWSAVLGAHGAYITQGKRGYRGALVVRFKKKIFCCLFSGQDISLKFHGNVANFEQAWQILAKNIPEDLPFTTLEDFPQIPAEDEFTNSVEQFINQSSVETL